MAEVQRVNSNCQFVKYMGIDFFRLGLMTGTLTIISSVAGILLLGLYYIATPPFIGYTYSMPMEGSYLIVNKT